LQYFILKNILKESLEVVHSTHYMITSKKGYLSGFKMNSVKILEIPSIIIGLLIGPETG
jgi:adenylate kinase